MKQEGAKDDMSSLIEKMQDLREKLLDLEQNEQRVLREIKNRDE